jgi:transposase InsO family protein
MGIWTRRHTGDDLSQLIHHSDRGVQYVAIRYTERLCEVDVVASVGSVGDSYDNAMAEAFNSLFKAELVRNKGPWNGINDLELAVADEPQPSRGGPGMIRNSRGSPRSRRPIPGYEDHYIVSGGYGPLGSRGSRAGTACLGDGLIAIAVASDTQHGHGKQA